MARRSPMNERYQKDTARRQDAQERGRLGKPKRVGAVGSSSSSEEVRARRASKPLVASAPAVRVPPEVTKLQELLARLLGAAVAASPCGYWLRGQALDGIVGWICSRSATLIFAALYIDWTQVPACAQGIGAAEQADGRRPRSATKPRARQRRPRTTQNDRRDEVLTAREKGSATEMARYEIYVTYKKGIFDPPGATAERALANLGYEGVDEVKIGKYIQLDWRRRPEAQVREMCDKLLANPVIEDYRIETVGEA